MLRYNQYLKETNAFGEYKKGDKVIFSPLPGRGYYSMHKGALCEVVFDYGISAAGVREYSIKTPSGARITAPETELKPEKPTTSTTMADMIENQFPSKTEDMPMPGPPNTGEVKTEPKTETQELGVGQRVIVNGSDAKISFNNRKGTVKKQGRETYLIAFDEDDSQNLAAETMLVDKDFVKPLDEPTNTIFGIGDRVECVDRTSQFFGQTGDVENVWEDDNTCMVVFPGSAGKTSIFMRPDQIKIKEFGKKETSFKREIPVGGPPAKTEPKKVEEEEEEEDGVTISVTPFKKEDLIEFSYKDFLLEEKISTLDELKASKTKFEDQLKDTNVTDLKKIFAERALKTLEIVEQYYDFLTHKIAGGLPVYRTVEQIENEDLLKTKTKVRASESKELTRKYSFDQGIIVYWKFKDAVVFRTLPSA